jgi:hypothetical protein
MPVQVRLWAPNLQPFLVFVSVRNFTSDPQVASFTTLIAQAITTCLLSIN